MTEISKIDLLIKLHTNAASDSMSIAYKQRYWTKFNKKILSEKILSENYWRKDYCTISEKRMIRKDLFDLLFKQNYFLVCPYCHFSNSIFEIKNNIELTQKNYKDKLKVQNVKNDSYLNNIFDIKPIIDSNETIYPIEIKKHFKALWVTERELLNAIFQNTDVDYSIFFKELLLVSANKFRPPIVMANIGNIEHIQNKILKLILVNNNMLKKTINDIQKTNNLMIKTSLKKSYKKLYNSLQHNINIYIDSSKDENNVSKSGIRQLLEKKEGIFRKSMMGKRVNYTARTIINPDPSLKTSEVGVPLYIALELTYDEPVNSYNYDKLYKAVINGPNIHPGATAIIENGFRICLDMKTKQERKDIANRLLTVMSLRSTKTNKQQSFIKHRYSQRKVQRHLENNDIVLMNRQPTLHRASILAHRVYIQHNSKVLRFHYANCNSYNADFDGDEMNLHFPQNELARSEAYNLINTESQFCVPKNGSPLRGIFQDCIVSALLLTKRDTFFTKKDVLQLLYQGLVDVDLSYPIYIGLPSILKPKKLYTGKQIISFLLSNIIGLKYEGITMNKRSHTPDNIWNNINLPCEENHLIIRQNYLCQGVLDKYQLAEGNKYSLVHSLESIYGSNISEFFLTSSSRIFSFFLQQFWGFSARLEDFEVTKIAEKKRKVTLKNSLSESIEIVMKTIQKNIGSSNYNYSEIKKFILNSSFNSTIVDRTMISFCNSISNEIMNSTFPNGTHIVFPNNNFLLMILTGAKGSAVNMSYILSCLGQQVLEGKRVPIMISGKTLPSFIPFDLDPRSGGFISNRFLTGLYPQEYFFHCMSGREGLIDTAVKTSRSGYLQRCLIKHLEPLYIAYDYSVRDSNSNIIQFVTGEDGLDTVKTSYLKKFKFLVDNSKDLNKKLPKVNNPKWVQNIFKEYLRKKKSSINKKNMSISELIINVIPPCYLGSISEYFGKQSLKYFKKWSFYINNNSLTKKKFILLSNSYYLKCISNPGEMVGIIAAQSIGEPSTQMTLNTFHLAGHADANITLGIVRVRELLMNASKDIKTPTMTLYCQDKYKAKQLKQNLKKFVLQDLITEYTLYGPWIEKIDNISYRIYKLIFNYLGYHKLNIDENILKQCIETTFCNDLKNSILISNTANSTKYESKEMKKYKLLKKDFKQSVMQKSSEITFSDDSSKKILRNINTKYTKDKFITNIEIQLPTTFKKILLISLIDDLIKKIVIRYIPNINSCYYIKKKEGNKYVHKITTEGINIIGVLKYSDLFDINSIETNSICHTFDYLGIEAGRASIVREIKNILNVYGLSVNYRHLGLVADYMTQFGFIRGLNRTTMSQCTSPFQRITFESSLDFITSSCFTGDMDNLVSPSSALIHGVVPKLGTNICDILYDLNIDSKSYKYTF